MELFKYCARLALLFASLILLLVWILSIAGCTKLSQSPSDQCLYAWAMRDKIANVQPTTISEIELKSAWLDRAKECDTFPQSIQF